MRKRFVITLFFAFSQLLLLAVPSAAEDADIQVYIERHVGLARLFAQPKGIPISICIAQALHESNAGRSLLAMEANNHFGIKAHDKKSWTGEKFYMKDDDRDRKTGKLVESPFRKYGSVVESFKDYVRYLSTTQRYKHLFQIPAANYRAWAEALGKSGYATDSTYAQRLIQKIEQYELYRYDDLQIPASSLPLTADEMEERKVEGKMAGVAVPTKKENFANAFGKKQEKTTRGSQTAAAPSQPKAENLGKKRLAVPPPPCPTPPQNLDPKQAKPIFMPIKLKTE